jgi:tripeptidyl-peptidase-1
MTFRYHLPSHIQEHVDYITPGIKVFAPARKEKKRNPDSSLDKRIFGVTSGKGNIGVCILRPIL